jgi:hypothetical protein
VRNGSISSELRNAPPPPLPPAPPPPLLAPALLLAPTGVASPSRNTTPRAYRGPRVAARPTTAAPAEWPTRTGALAPVSPLASRNAMSWPAISLVLNGAVGALYPVPMRSIAYTRWWAAASTGPRA